MTSNDRDRTFSAVVEGQCPHGHGALDRRPLRLSMEDETEAGWCEPCRRGYSARTHRHTEHCAGPDLDEAEWWCPFTAGERVVTFHDPVAFGVR